MPSLVGSEMCIRDRDGERYDVDEGITTGGYYGTVDGGWEDGEIIEDGEILRGDGGDHEK